MRRTIDQIICQLEEIQNGKPWIGTTYTTKLGEIDESHVFTRPLEGMHSVAEIISHLTLWRKETILKMRSGKGSRTEDCEENWLSNDKLRVLGWDYLKSEYDRTLSEIISLLKSREDAFLSKLYYDTDFKGNFTYNFVINGMLHHDIYHLGQLGLIIRFLNKK